MRLLFVCTGNLCRSPLAERLLRSWADRELGATAAMLQIDSAGTAAATGPMEARSAQALRELGGDPSGAQARQLRDGETADVDLVLTITRRQRREVLRRDPRAMRRTVTLAEAAGLLPLTDRSSLGPIPLDGRMREL